MRKVDYSERKCEKNREKREEKKVKQTTIQQGKRVFVVRKILEYEKREKREGKTNRFERNFIFEIMIIST